MKNQKKMLLHFCKWSILGQRTKRREVSEITQFFWIEHRFFFFSHSEWSARGHILNFWFTGSLLLLPIRFFEWFDETHGSIDQKTWTALKWQDFDLESPLFKNKCYVDYYVGWQFFSIKSNSISVGKCVVKFSEKRTQKSRFEVCLFNCCEMSHSQTSKHQLPKLITVFNMPLWRRIPCFSSEATRKLPFACFFALYCRYFLLCYKPLIWLIFS